MATTTTTAPTQETEKKPPLLLTAQAIAKVREIMAARNPIPRGLRMAVAARGLGTP